MMNFLKNLFHKKDTVQFAPGITPFTDYHCHILPGVDDGVKTLSDSLIILEQYEQLGISEVYLTPHIMEDSPNTTASLREVFSRLGREYTGNISLHLASENMIDGLFLERLEKDDVLTLKNDMLLVETSYYNPPIGLYDILEEIIEKGYKPVLAHPERYVYMGEKDYGNLLSKGISLQLNLLSLKGCYGRDAQIKAADLCRKKAYSFIGSDLHNPMQVLQIKSVLSSPHTSKMIGHALKRLT